MVVPLETIYYYYDITQFHNIQNCCCVLCDFMKILGLFKYHVLFNVVVFCGVMLCFGHRMIRYFF